ncbi:MAG: class I SAM-dependent methyltransferase [Nitrospirae bacterium]|nr:class I SAM-dependent methyltransferase [Nitrospirota bacterium]
MNLVRNLQGLKYHLRKLKRRLSLPIFLMQNYNEEKFTCPICLYTGPFKGIKSALSGLHRKFVECPVCGAFERHRLQYLVVNNVLETIHPSGLKMLHFAPEPFFREFFSKRFGKYETADLSMSHVDHNVDLQKLPFDDQTYDFVFASHVLEHIPNDGKALSEIRRILKPKGIAVLPVPIVAEKTIEYPEPNPNEEYHVRAPGLDYYDRYDRYFSKVDKISSDMLPGKYQLYTYEDRSQWPTEKCPLRLSMPGEKHIDIVPVCYV